MHPRELTAFCVLLIHGAAAQVFNMMSQCPGPGGISSASHTSVISQAGTYYGNNLNCATIITAANANNVLRLVFTKLDLQQYGDYVSIFDGNSTAATLLFTDSRSTLYNVPTPLSTVNTTGPAAYVQFTTNGNGSGYKGFAFTIAGASRLPADVALLSFESVDVFPFVLPVTLCCRLATMTWQRPPPPAPLPLRRLQ